MNEDTKNSIIKVFGWPDASWVRAWTMMDNVLRSDREGKRARKKLCEAAELVVIEDVKQVNQLLEDGNFQVAHAYTNELLELAKMKRVTCDVSPIEAATTRRRDLDFVVKPKEAPKSKKRQITRDELDKLIPSRSELKQVEASTKAETKAIEEFLKEIEKEEEEASIITPTTVPEPEPKPEPEPVKKKVLGLKARKVLDKKTDDLRKATTKLKGLWYNLPEQTRKKGVLTPKQNAALVDGYKEMTGLFISVLEDYENLENQGYALPTGNLKKVGKTIRENESFQKRIEKASTLLLDDVFIQGDYPSNPLLNVNDSELRRKIMLSLVEIREEEATQA